MGLFKKKKKKAKVVEKTASQQLNEEIKTHTTTVDNLERLKPRVNKLITYYKKQLPQSSRKYVHGSGITLTFAKGFTVYPDGFFAFADKVGLNIEPLCSNRYDYNPELSFVVRAKTK